MYGALSQLPYLWDQKKQTGGKSFKVVIWGGNASHKEEHFYGKEVPYITVLVPSITILPILYLLRLERPKVPFKVS